MSEFQAHMVAYEIEAAFQDAAGDIAESIIDCGIERKWLKVIRRLKSNGCRGYGLQAALADEVYSDPESFTDFAGDRICESIPRGTKSPEYEQMFNEVCQELVKIRPRMEKAIIEELMH